MIVLHLFPKRVNFNKFILIDLSCQETVNCKICEKRKETLFENLLTLTTQMRNKRQDFRFSRRVK